MLIVLFKVRACKRGCLTRSFLEACRTKTPQTKLSSTQSRAAELTAFRKKNKQKHVSQLVPTAYTILLYYYVPFLLYHSYYPSSKYHRLQQGHQQPRRPLGTAEADVQCLEVLADESTSSLTEVTESSHPTAPFYRSPKWVGKGPNSSLTGINW